MENQVEQESTGEQSANDLDDDVSMFSMLLLLFYNYYFLQNLIIYIPDILSFPFLNPPTLFYSTRF